MNTKLPSVALLVFGLSFVSSVCAQDAGASDPFAVKRNDHAEAAHGHDHEAPKLKRECISYSYEVFSLPVATAGELQRKKLADAELYASLVQTGKLERLTIVRSEQGIRFTSESISEYRYPTEFRIEDRFAKKASPDPAAEKNNAAEREDERQMVPVSFETRNTGDSIEIESTPESGTSVLNLNISIQHVALAKTQVYGHGRMAAEQPLFESQKIATTVSATIGQPRLIGTMNPPFGNGVTQRGEQNVWFAFITPKPLNAAAAK